MIRAALIVAALVAALLALVSPMLALGFVALASVFGLLLGIEITQERRQERRRIAIERARMRGDIPRR